MKILIIEDELPAARQLTKLVGQALPEATVIDVLDSIEGAVRWFRTFPSPDLVFLDIQIADGLSFDIFRQVTVEAPVIFTTAFDQYAVQAFRVNAIDYLLKPVDPSELERALNKVKSGQTARGLNLSMEQFERFFQKDIYKERFLVKAGQQLIFIPAVDIAYFRSSDGLTQAYTFSGKKYFVDHTLEDLEKVLDPRDYFRISRAMLLRINSIQRIFPHLNGRLKLETAPQAPEDVFVSRERTGEFKVWLGG